MLTKKTIGHGESSVNRAVRLLRTLANERGPGAKLPTHRDICTLMGVSRFTLDAALETLEAQNVIWRRQGSGIFVSNDLHRKSIAVVMQADIARSSSLFGSLIWGQCIRQCDERALRQPVDYHFHLTTPRPGVANGLPPELARRLKEGALHGVIGLGMNFSLETLPSQHSVPTVVCFGWGDWIVELYLQDELIHAGVQSLAAKGCKRIGLLGQYPGYELVPEWFCERLKDCGLPFLADIIRFPRMDDDQRRQRIGWDRAQQVGWDLAREIFRGDDLHPDGLLITTDEIAQGALLALRDLGIRPGVDVQIAAHANVGSPTLFGFEDKIIRIAVNPERIVEALLNVMEQVLAGNPPTERKIVMALTVIDPGETGL